MKRIPDVAKDLKISERQVATWISAGILRAYRVGRLVFLDLEEVYEDIKRHGSPKMCPDQHIGGGLEDSLGDDSEQL